MFRVLLSRDYNQVFVIDKLDELFRRACVVPMLVSVEDVIDFISGKIFGYEVVDY